MLAHLPLPSWLTLVLLVTAPVAVFGQEEKRSEPLTGKAFHQKLASYTPLTWQQAPLGKQLQRFADHHRMTVWLDRRVDPQQKVSVDLAPSSLESLFYQIAQHLELGVAIIDHIVYIGPRATTERLESSAASSAAAAARLPQGVRSGLQRRATTQWPLLTTPREALQKVAMASGLAWSSLDAVPHDLMPARRLAGLTTSDQLCLLLAGFDLTYRWSKEDGLTLAPLPAVELKTQTYTAPPERRVLLTDVLRMYPSATSKATERSLVVRGPVGLHRAIQRTLRAKPPVLGAPGSGRHTLKAKGMLGNLAKQLSLKLGLQLEMAPGVNLTQQVAFEVHDATAEQLFQALAQAAKLKASLKGGTIYITP